ncbi:methyltransferase domain-containing protein [Clostridium drakei]|uniref:Methyltransferase type 11 domain-containing protein n=1 Tax=Clostridium drakei TaxID=332101 RepID=A0A2U8DLV4_9CLOT|nr:methyltransferase domain-containing protein [Clostridium drakei]AWI03679.1 hypothetical protein B9W14_04005 [Clostridium drakei]
MDKISILNKVKEIYLHNGNIISYLKKIDGAKNNSIEDILISYDFQSGSYDEEYSKDPILNDKYKLYCSYISNIIYSLGEYDSLLEVGVGDGTTLGNVLILLKKMPQRCYGFDLSWSRIKYARNFLKKLKINDVKLFTADLFSTPLKDNSIDIVYTSHSIEPNGGREKDALVELYRITNKYLILIEPAYEFASDKAKERMIKCGYITRLYSTAKGLGYNIVEHRLLETSLNPLNPTGVIIIKKESNLKTSNPLCCPVTKSNIIQKDNAYYSKDSLLAYPIIDEIPCLLGQNAIIATKFLDDI